MLNRSFLRASASHIAGRVLLRTFAAAVPAADPLELLKSTSFKRQQCDEAGYRLPGVHWTLSVAFNAEDPSKPPNLRTVGFQRVTEHGIDFVVKSGSQSVGMFQAEQPVSILVQSGRYVPGEVAEQWRAEGHCEAIPLQDLIHVLPDYTVAHMVSSRRMQGEGTETSDSDRSVVGKSTSRLTEVVQHVRNELEDNKLDPDEIVQSVKAFRFIPDRVEFMSGGPDSVLWDRWEWTRSPSGDCPEGSLGWDEPKSLLPH